MKKINITVTSAQDTYNMEIEDFFDDPFMEACTRVIEHKRNVEKSMKLAPFMFAGLKRKNSDTRVYNTYIALINGGFHLQAENLRVNYKKDSGVDLSLEPVKSK